MMRIGSIKSAIPLFEHNGDNIASEDYDHAWKNNKKFHQATQKA